MELYNMIINIYYNPEKREYIFKSGDNELRVNEEEFNYMKKTPNALFYHITKDR